MNSKRQEVNKKMLKFLDNSSKKFKKAGITAQDIKEEIKKARADNN